MVVFIVKKIRSA